MTKAVDPRTPARAKWWASPVLGRVDDDEEEEEEEDLVDLASSASLGSAV